MLTFSSFMRFSQFRGIFTMTISGQSMTTPGKNFRILTLNLHPNMAIPTKYAILFHPMKKVQMKRVSVTSGGMHSEKEPHLSHLRKLNNG